MDLITTAHKEEQKMVKGMVDHITKVQDEVKHLTKVVQRQAMMIKHLQDHNQFRDTKHFKNDLIIQGIETDTTEMEQGLKEIVTDFFSQTMKIRKNVVLRSVARQSQKNPSALIVTLQHAKDKGIIFKNIKELNGRKNNSDENYYINNRLTLEGQEQQRRHRFIKKANFHLPPTERLNITHHKGELIINSETYRKSVVTPDVTDIISPSDLQKVEEIYHTVGECVKNEKCRFYAVSQEIRNIEDVRLGYIKAKCRFADALHVSCAYYLPGPNVARNCDFVDDLESGTGRTLTDLLYSHNIVHRAIFVARYYGGKQLGPSRFTSYKEAAISAISRSSYNSITKRN